MIEAVVQTGCFETAYRRAGNGAAVLLLGAGGGEMEWPFEALAARYRVVAPARPVIGPEGDSDGGNVWLRGVIDGLGLDRPGVVAGAGDGPWLLAFAAIDPHRVGRVVLLSDGEAHVPLAAALAAALHPVLLLSLPPAGDAARRAAENALVAFLDQG